jgi:AcrR family transcriptional regulator
LQQVSTPQEEPSHVGRHRTIIVVRTMQNVNGCHDDDPPQHMTGRREANKVRTRERLIEAAFELFLTRGYDETSVTDLADAAKVAERTYFRYFASKEDVVFADLDDARQEYLDCLGDALLSPVPTWSDIAAGLREYARRYEPARELTLRRAELLARTPTLRARASQIQAAWRVETASLLAARYDIDERHLDIQLLAGLASTVLGAAAAEWTRTDEPLETTIAKALDRHVAIVRIAPPETPT